MRRILNIFRINPEERLLAFFSAIIFALLNTLTVVRYYGSFSQLSDSSLTGTLYTMSTATRCWHSCSGP